MKVSASLGSYQDEVNRGMAQLRQDRIMARIWTKDYTVWKPSPAEITNRLGWLDSPRTMADHLDEMGKLTEDVRKAGCTQALLLGMGGSSLAPEVFRKIFGVAPGHPDLAVLDSTDPGAVLTHGRAMAPSKALFIVSTKSGGTVETFSLMKYFYNLTADALGSADAGRHFIAITDPGSGLADTAEKLHFRHIFYNDPDIGGRYSALT
ncbi:MAG: hypothetical protein PHN75_12595, partial [Syntrophales bacterium]|nr:hypothetical protein [Syntrophales bacterium]